MDVVIQSLRREGTRDWVEEGTPVSCTYLLCGESTNASSSSPKVCVDAKASSDSRFGDG